MKAKITEEGSSSIKKMNTWETLITSAQTKEAKKNNTPDKNSPWKAMKRWLAKIQLDSRRASIPASAGGA